MGCLRVRCGVVVGLQYDQGKKWLKSGVKDEITEGAKNCDQSIRKLIHMS